MFNIIPIPHLSYLRFVVSVTLLSLNLRPEMAQSKIFVTSTNSNYKRCELSISLP